MYPFEFLHDQLNGWIIDLNLVIGVALKAGVWEWGACGSGTAAEGECGDPGGIADCVK